MTLLGDTPTAYWLMFCLGYILNFYLLYVVFWRYIVQERENKKIIDASRRKKSGQTAKDGEESDDL